MIRTLTLAEIETLVDWAADEGWNPGLHDAPAFQTVDPEGFIGAFVDGRMAAGISVVRYNEAFGFLGLYISHPDFRAQGHGRAVWQAGRAHLGQRTVGLDGVDAQLANYRRQSFAPAYRTVRWSGTLQAPDPASSVRPVMPADLPALGRFDRLGFPAERLGFLSRWIAPPHVASVLSQDGAISGYGVARPCRDGWKIGPLLATDDDGAFTLFQGLAAQTAAQPVHLDVPQTHAGFTARLEAAGMAPGFETTRMYRGPAPDHPTIGTYAVTTLELG